MFRPVAFTRRELIAQADVAERAAHQNFMVPAARAVAVELATLDALRHQVAAGRAVGRDAAGGGDVVRGDRVAEDDEGARLDDVAQGAGFRTQALEEGRLAHVGRLRIPVIDRPGRRRHPLPVLIAIEDALVFPREHLDLQRGADRLIDLRGRRPEFLQEDLLPVPVGSQRIGCQVAADISGERVGDHQRW